jgi:hypothetical protein
MLLDLPERNGNSRVCLAWKCLGKPRNGQCLALGKIEGQRQEISLLRCQMCRYGEVNKYVMCACEIKRSKK